MVVGCTPTETGCYGYWEKKRDGLQRGTRAGWNTGYKHPYRQCVDKDPPMRTVSYTHLTLPKILLV